MALLIIAVALLMLLGADILTRGSRNTLSRAMASSRAHDIASLALAEACLSTVGRRNILDLLERELSGLGAGSAFPLGASVERIGWRDPDGNFRQEPAGDGVRPVDGESGRFWKEVRPGSTIRWISWHPANTVAFTDPEVGHIEPAALRRACSGDPGFEGVDPVEVRPVLLMVPESAPTTGGPRGHGILRLRATARYRMAGRVVRRTVIEERVFVLWQMGPDDWALLFDRDPWRFSSHVQS